MYFDGGSEASLYVFERPLEKFENRLFSQTSLKNTELRVGTIHKQLR